MFASTAIASSVRQGMSWKISPFQRSHVSQSKLLSMVSHRHILHRSVSTESVGQEHRRGFELIFRRYHTTLLVLFSAGMSSGLQSDISKVPPTTPTPRNPTLPMPTFTPHTIHQVTGPARCYCWDSASVRCPGWQIHHVDWTTLT